MAPLVFTKLPNSLSAHRSPVVLLKDGDVFEVTAEGLGTLRNPFVAPKG